MGAVVLHVALGQEQDEVACAAELAGSSPAEGFEGFAEFWVLQDDEPPALGSDGARGEAGDFEDVGDVVVADFSSRGQRI